MRRIAFLIGVFFLVISGNAQNVGIGTTTPDPSAKLEVQSTNSGFLPPRMTFAQRNAIVNPAAGLIVWCLDCVTGGELSVYNGSTWTSAFGSGSNNGGNSGTPPLAPTNLRVSVSSPIQYATLNWNDESTNETGYKIERQVNDGLFTIIGQVNANVTRYNDSSINDSTKYRYRVYAYNSSGNSIQYSNVVEICNLNSVNIQGTYKITASTYQANAQSTLIDDYSSWNACEKDDLFVFANGTLTSSEGAISCNPPTDPFNAIWSLNGNQFTISLSGISFSYTVEFFSCNQIVLKYVDSVDNSIQRITFNRQ
jgi:hypothetical protein